jgi:hypothetical protein
LRIQQPVETIFKLVHRKPVKSGGKLGEVRRNVGRWAQQRDFGPRRLHLGYKNICKSSKNILPAGLRHASGHVCKFRELTIGKICKSLASFSGHRLQCLGSGPPVSTVFSSLVGQPPMDHYSPMAGETPTASSSGMWDGSTQVGWDRVVAPLSSFAYEGDPGNRNLPQGGPIPELPGRSSPWYKMAPALPDIIRAMLQRKQVSPENINFYLTKLKNLQRYDQAFKKLWALWAKNQPSNMNPPPLFNKSPP